MNETKQTHTKHKTKQLQTIIIQLVQSRQPLCGKKKYMHVHLEYN
jgi:hypothetical protein